MQDGASTKPPPRRQGSATRQAHLQPSKPTCVRSQTIHSQRSRFTNSCSQGRAGQGRERKGGPTVERRSAGVAVGSQRQVSGPPAVGSRRAGHPQLSRALPARGHLQAHTARGAAPAGSHLAVVDVWRRAKELPRGEVACPAVLGVVPHNRPLIPAHAPPKLVPHAALPLVLRAAVVEHRVAQHLDAVALQRLDTPAGGGGRQGRGMRSAQDCSRAQTASS